MLKEQCEQSRDVSTDAKHGAVDPDVIGLSELVEKEEFGGPGHRKICESR
jgi:hypothetical protein